MSDKITINLGSVQKTLLLPLWGRALETLKDDPLLTDNTALEIIKKIDYDFATISKNLSIVTQLAWIGRSLQTDRIIRNFLVKYPKATIIDIGCGMDTNFERVDNGSLRWYDLDLPDVIELRRKFFQESDRRKFISCSLLDYRWFEQLKIEDNVLFVAAGVLYYFEEEQVKNFVVKMADLFPGAELLFDAASPLGVKTANKRVIKNSGMNERSFLKWGLKKNGDILAWDNRIIDLKKYSFFEDFRSKLNFKLWVGTQLSDLLNIMYMVHLRFQ